MKHLTATIIALLIGASPLLTAAGPSRSPDVQRCNNIAAKLARCEATTSTSDNRCNKIAIKLDRCRARLPTRGTPTPLPAPISTPSEAQPTRPASKLDRPPARFIQATPSMREQHEQGHVLLYFANSNTVDLRIQQIEQKFHIRPIQRIHLNALSGEVILYITDEDQNTFKNTLRDMAPEAIIDSNKYYYSLNGPRQYFASHIQLNMPPPQNTNIPVGIIDTDVADVPALKSSKIIRQQFLPTLSNQASNKHGTAIALLIAGQHEASHFYGVAPGAPLFVANVMRKAGKQNNTNTLLLVKAIDWLLSKKVRVINLSLGGPGDAIMRNLFKQMRNKPVILVAAAGNNGPKAPPSYPAAYTGVLAVTATNANKQIYKHANQGDYIDIAAPGEDVWVPVSSQGQYMSGTSFSAALVTGAIAKQDNQANNQSLSDIRKSLLIQTFDLGIKGRDQVFGEGLLQLNQ